MKSWRQASIDFLTWLKRDKRTLLSSPEQIYIDPHIYQLPVNEPPSPTTDGKIAAQRVMSRHNTAAIEAMIRAQHSNAPRTEMLPVIHKCTLVPHSEPLRGSTLYETPAFLGPTWKEKKVS